MAFRLSPASTRTRVESGRMNVEFPELELARIETVTIGFLLGEMRPELLL